MNDFHRRTEPHPLEQFVPELTLFPDEASRDAALKSMPKVVYGWGYWLYLAICALVFLFLVPLVDTALRWGAAQGIPTWLSGGAIAFAGLAFFLWGMAAIWSKAKRRYIRTRLLKLGIPVCIRCGYDARGNSSERCPECGAINPSAASPENVA